MESNRNGSKLKIEFSKLYSNCNNQCYFPANALGKDIHLNVPVVYCINQKPLVSFKLLFILSFYLTN